MGASNARPVVLDAGALIAVERADRRVLALLAVAADMNQPVVVPAGVVGQVWRDGRRQARIARVVHARETIVEALDLPTAEAAGLLCGAAGTDDVIDAAVVVAARRYRGLAVTSESGDLVRLDPSIEIHQV